MIHRRTPARLRRRVPVATDEPARTATVTVTRTAQGVRVRWSVSPSSDVTAVFEALTAGGTEHYLGGSSAAYVDLRGHIRGWSPGKEGNEAGDYCQNQEQSASAFYLSSGGYGLWADTDHVGRFAFPGAAQGSDGPTCAKTPKPPSGAAQPYPCPVAATARPDRVQICVKDAGLSYDVYTGSPAAVTGAYYRTVGLPSMPPASEFALMKWRDVNADQAQVLDDVAQLKRLDIPLGTIGIDNPWERQPAGNTHRINGSACTNSGEFDPTFFPDPQRMIDEIHAQGVRFGLWVTSHVVSAPSSSQGGGSCAGINDVWAKNGWLVPGTNYIDFTNPAAREHYVDQLTRIFRMGVDMAKEDRSEEYRFETTPFAGGPGAGLYLRYPDLYQSAVTEAMRRAHDHAGDEPGRVPAVPAGGRVDRVQHPCPRRLADRRAVPAGPERLAVRAGAGPHRTAARVRRDGAAGRRAAAPGAPFGHRGRPCPAARGRHGGAAHRAGGLDLHPRPVRRRRAEAEPPRPRRGRDDPLTSAPSRPVPPRRPRTTDPLEEE
ncbi:TIM-barrel domain-containing protein [Actinoallomurus sp. NPDC052308]|uniref:TIM-barrel domain-containing protein n=1 Tax=Actinoallomurus sp. NPDC052308 TaxID=3155530 RepID=UPI00342840A4